MAGLEVVACVNHWPIAIRTHQANHPHAQHFCQDAALMDPRDRYALVDGDQMRMLTVAEYRRAMGFRETYIAHGNRAEQVKQYGNAVCPPVAADILRQVA